jgi:hypothetical protein
LELPLKGTVKVRDAHGAPLPGGQCGDCGSLWSACATVGPIY